jgi:hypothetical protein
MLLWAAVLAAFIAVLSLLPPDEPSGPALSEQERSSLAEWRQKKERRDRDIQTLQRAAKIIDDNR